MSHRNCNKVDNITDIDDKIEKTKLREKIIFGEPNPVETMSILYEQGIVDPDKLSSLREEITRLNLRLFELCENLWTQ